MQEFSLEKLKNSILKAGAPADVAEKIANKISGKIREGISTSEIKTMVISSLQSANAVALHQSPERFIKNRKLTKL